MTDEKTDIICKICGWDRNVHRASGSGLERVQLALIHCPRCGTYKITDEAEEDGVMKEVQTRLHLLSGAIRYYHENGLGPFVVDSEVFGSLDGFNDKVMALVPRTIEEKSDRILRYLKTKSISPGFLFDIDLDSDYPIAFCKKGSEFNFFIQHLKDMGFVSGAPTMDVKNRRNGWSIMMTPAGWQRLEHLENANEESTQGFVAMWFDDTVNHIFREAIEPAGKEAGFKMLRIDTKEFNEKICDQIIAEIRRSRFVVAEFTGHRQGVYFEAGFAMGLGIPVIWTCHKDHLNECHFDTRQYNHIVWTTPEELKEKLTRRIMATIVKAQK